MDKGDQIKETFDDIIKRGGWYNFVKPILWDGHEALGWEDLKYHKISIVTTAMDRLEDVKQTLPKNIEDNRDYPNIEFVLLDYNSRDGLWQWVYDNMGGYISDGILNYYHTENPKHYSMVHSRNVAFKLATGDIVHSVDADNFTNGGFAAYTNYLANLQPQKAVFGKGKKMMRGRLGFYRGEFIEELGGYDETFVGYGTDDHDILQRAWGLGYKLMWYGGKYYDATPDHQKHRVENFANQEWRYTEKINKIISCYNLSQSRFKANAHREWGKETLTRNFKEEVKV